GKRSLNGLSIVLPSAAIRYWGHFADMHYRKARFASTITLLLGFAVSGCQSSPPMYTTYRNNLLHGAVKLGMTRTEVESRVGAPARTEKIGTTEFLYYNFPWYLPSMSAGSLQPIAMEGNKVVGVGAAYYKFVA